jgi:hypothetical protein
MTTIRNSSKSSRPRKKVTRVAVSYKCAVEMIISQTATERFLNVSHVSPLDG